MLGELGSVIAGPQLSTSIDNPPVELVRFIVFPKVPVSGVVGLQ